MGSCNKRLFHVRFHVVLMQTQWCFLVDKDDRGSRHVMREGHCLHDKKCFPCLIFFSWNMPREQLRPGGRRACHPPPKLRWCYRLPGCSCLLECDDIPCWRLDTQRVWNLPFLWRTSFVSGRGCGWRYVWRLNLEYKLHTNYSILL